MSISKQIRGRYKGLVVYERMGVVIARSYPSRVRQTKATKQAAQHFGKAVRASAELRGQLREILGTLPKRSIQYRLNNALLQASIDGFNTASDSWRRLSCFPFNDKKPLDHVFKKSITANFENDKLIIRIPDFNPRLDCNMPAHTKDVEIKFAVVSTCIYANGRNVIPVFHMTSPIIVFYINNSYPAREIELPCKIQEGLMVMVAAGVGRGVGVIGMQYKDCIPEFR